MELTREKLESAFAKVISKNRDLDPLTLSEKLVERLSYIMEDADGGSDLQPVRIVDEASAATEPEPPRKKVSPMRPRDTTAAPPVPSSSIIVAPDEQAMQEALEHADPRLRGSAAPKPKAGRPQRLSSVGGGQAPSAGIEYWTLEELIKSLMESTPEQFYFTPNGCEVNVKVLAKRNVRPIIMTQGPSIVRLEYASPDVSEDHFSTNERGELDVAYLSLIASQTFTLDQNDLDIPGKMDKIEETLKGLYAPRTQFSEPMGRDPGPIESMFNMNDPNRRTPMGENFRMETASGWRGASATDGSDVEKSVALVRQGVIDSNKRFGNNR